MDIQAYIESGILEAYVLGTATDKERREVECMSSIHEEIAQELQSLASTVEKYHQASAVAPPPSLKDAIFAEIEEEEAEEEEQQAPPAPKLNVERGGVDFDAPEKSFKWANVAVAASVLLAATFGGMYFKERGETTALEADYAGIVEDKSNLEGRIAALEENYTGVQQLLSFMADTATKVVPMKGIPEKAEEAYATVYWNTNTNTAYLNVTNLPEAPKGKQYQLWGIVDGQPTDMGVFDLSTEKGFQKVKNIKGAQAFAVTLEDEGGVESPTLSEMYVLGKV